MPMLDHLRRVLQHTITRADIATDHAARAFPQAHVPKLPPERRATSRISLAPRHRLPVALVRLLGADCAACRGIGCPTCAHTGLQ